MQKLKNNIVDDNVLDFIVRDWNWRTHLLLFPSHLFKGRGQQRRTRFG